MSCSIRDPFAASTLWASVAAWQCLEIGGGGGSIAAWLSERVGPRGRVVVTDIQTQSLEQLRYSNLEVVQHNAVTDPLPEGAFDLVHARLLLGHLPQREVILKRMVAALKPGGWIVIEAFDRNFNDFSYPSTNAEGAALYQKMQTVFGHLMEARGVDPVWGRSLYRRLRALGLVDVGMEGYMAAREGGSAGARLARANFEQIRQEATAAGLITDKEVAQMFTLLDDPDFAYGSHIMFTAWGRRPQS